MVERATLPEAPATSACQRSSSTRSLRTAPSPGRWAETSRSWKRNEDPTTKRGLQPLSWRCASPAGCHQKSERQRQRQTPTVESIARGRAGMREMPSGPSGRAQRSADGRPSVRKGGCQRPDGRLWERTPTAAARGRARRERCNHTHKSDSCTTLSKRSKASPYPAISAFGFVLRKICNFHGKRPEGAMRDAGSALRMCLAN